MSPAHQTVTGGQLPAAVPWVCDQCEVGGADNEINPPCWNCGGPTVTSRRSTALDALRVVTMSAGRPMAPW